MKVLVFSYTLVAALLGTFPSTVTGQSEMCQMCASGTPANKDLVIPFLKIGDDNIDPTCEQVADFGLEEVAAADEICTLIKSHKDFCGCPEGSVTPLNNCFLCPDGSAPTNLNSQTPFEDTCSELDTYLRYLPSDLCNTTRADDMKRSDVFCGCPGVVADCYMCSDQTNNLANPDRMVPFFEFLVSGFSATCNELAAFYTLYKLDDPQLSTCEFVQLESRYCGCESESVTTPVNECSLCTDGTSPTASTRFIDEIGMTCGELQTYLDYVTADQCAMPWITDLLRFDYYCGCTAATPFCPICPDGSVEVSNPESIIPYLVIPNNENPTCQNLATLGVTAEPEELNIQGCSIFTDHAAFCGCTNTTKPTDGCDFCPGGTTPTNPDLVTPFGDTCTELNDYVSYLTSDQCGSDRVGFIQRQDFLCGCPEATTQCALCNNHGSNAVTFPERHIPLLSLPQNPNPTCQEVIEFISINDGALTDDGCTALQTYEGYCGCPEASPLNQCSFCPNGGTPATPDKVVSELFTCQALQDFVSFLPTDNCQADNADFLQIQAFAYICGCPNVQPACTLCSDGEAPTQPDKLLADGVTRCDEFAELVMTLTADQCTQETSALNVASSECGCRGSGSGAESNVGRCAVQQNSNLCTTELLDSVSEQCDCYSFCGSTFVKCQSIEGGLLTASECTGTPITGCNRAGAEANGSSPSSGGGGSTDSANSSTESEARDDGDDNQALVIGLAVGIPAFIAVLVTVYYCFTRKSKAENDKMNAVLENESEDHDFEQMNGSPSMSDDSYPAPPNDSFSSMGSSPVRAEPNNKMV